MIDLDEVMKVARLARLQFDESDLSQVQKKLNIILEHFQSLSEVSTDLVAPTYQGITELSLRQDVAENPLVVGDLEKNAPEFMDNAFKLPRVVGTTE